MFLSKKRITKAVIRLRGCAGWSAPLLFANPRRQVFSRRGQNRRTFFAQRYVILSTCLHSYQIRLDIWCSGCIYIYYAILYRRKAMTLVILLACAVSPELLLVACVISYILICVESAHFNVKMSVDIVEPN